MQHIKKSSNWFLIKLKIKKLGRDYRSQNPVERKPIDVLEFTRLLTTIIIVILISLIAVISVFKPGASKILEQLLPILMLIIGYYYSRKP